MLEALGVVLGSPLESAQALMWRQVWPQRQVVWDDASAAGPRPPLCLPVVFISCVCGIFTEGGHEQGGQKQLKLSHVVACE